MSNLINKLKNLFGKSSTKTTSEVSEPFMNDSRQSQTLPTHDESSLVLNEGMLTALMQQVAQTKEGMYTCEETFDLLDEYVELINTKQDAAQLLPLVKAHLDVCPDCEHEYEILLAIVRSTLDEA